MEKRFSLEQLIGERITAFIPMLRPGSTENVLVVLRGIEAGGVWIELDSQVLSSLRTSDGSVRLFITWPQILYIAALQPAPVAAAVMH